MIQLVYICIIYIERELDFLVCVLERCGNQEKIDFPIIPFQFVSAVY